MIYLHIFLICFIVVFIVDYSGAVPSLRAWINKRILKREEDAPLKPFDCSKCMTFWIGLIYVAACGRLSVPTLAAVCLAAYLAQVCNNFLFMVKDLIDRMANEKESK